ncbi:MAG: hypothetical protein KAI47_09860 [Deltaproteobacteria bacterium]|nr:hypothetical protein [Deltaproteobacteria bacterium]
MNHRLLHALGHYLICLIFITIFSVVMGACTSHVGTITLTLIRSPETSEDPLTGIADFVRVRVDGPEGRVGPVFFSQTAKAGILDDIPTGPSQVITVEGVGPEGNAVSRGRTVPLTIGSGDNAIDLFLGRVDHFSRTPKSAGGSPSGVMISARAFHTATLTVEDKVLLVGGIANGRWRPGSTPTPEALRQVESLDATSLRFARIDCKTAGRCPTFGRVGHSATALASGNVLIAGGIQQGLDTPRPVEVFATKTDRFLTGADLNTPRARHAAARRGDTVAIVGGALDGARQVIGSVERYEGGTLREQPQLHEPRRDFAMVRLGDGTFFVSGGFDAQGHAIASTEFLKPGAALWIAGPALAVARGFHTATVLPSGAVLIIGGLGTQGQATGTIEMFSKDAATHKTVGQLHLPRWAHTATLLGDQRLLVTGGFTLDVAGSPTRTVEEITVTSDTLINVKQPFSLHEERAGHTTTRLASGWLLIAGGITIHCDDATPPTCTDQPSPTAEVFVY